jgi:hypothetical protein
MDQAPGPIMAKVAPKVAKSRGIRGSPLPEKTINSSRAATMVPATGVHSPTRRRIAAAATVICGAIDPRFDAA